MEQSTQVHFSLEVGLGAGGEVGEDFWVGIPGGDATMILTTVLIIDDEGGNLVSETFFEHDQSTKATVAIFKGVDALKANMELQDITQLNFPLGFIANSRICFILKRNNDAFCQ